MWQSIACPWDKEEEQLQSLTTWEHADLFSARCPASPWGLPCPEKGGGRLRAVCLQVATCVPPYLLRAPGAAQPPSNQRLGAATERACEPSPKLA